MTLPETLCLSSEHYTPPELIESARQVMGSIDLDPASSPIANSVIKAKVFYTKETNGLDLTNSWEGNVYLNPPGDRTGKLVKAFWERLVNEVLNDNVRAGIWAGFNTNQLQSLQRFGIHPLLLPTCVVNKRIPWLGTDLEPQEQPLRANYFTVITKDSKIEESFAREFVQYGTVVGPYCP